MQVFMARLWGFFIGDAYIAGAASTWVHALLRCASHSKSCACPALSDLCYGLALHQLGAAHGTHSPPLARPSTRRKPEGVTADSTRRGQPAAWLTPIAACWQRRHLPVQPLASC
ncbi:MAG: hypothetical protein ACK5V2_13300, partial [Pseudomonadota bacterium]